MARPQLHPVDHMLDTARDLVLDGGARAATINRIAAVSGAPKGSLYHRFSTLDDLLAAMWLRAVRRAQAPFLQALERSDDPREAAVAAGLSVVDFAVEHPADARLLASLRRTDLVERVADAQMRADLDAANDELGQAIVGLTRRLYGRATRGALEATTLCVVDLPQGAVRRHLIGGSAPPHSVRRQLEAAIRAALDAG